MDEGRCRFSAFWLDPVRLQESGGFGRAELTSLLHISGTALRQRISGLRRAWKRAGMIRELVEPVLRPSPSGPRRRMLKTSLGKLPGGRLAVADPDGHVISFFQAASLPRELAGTA